ncbi:hypothetical protein AAHE18_U063700 [Arachis hypogaea]
MALKAVVYPQSQDPSFGYGVNYNNCYRNWSNSYNNEDQRVETTYPAEIWNNNNNNNNTTCSSPPSVLPSSCRPKRRRAKSRKNKEQIENQRMTHIAVERNRRKQMNHYLSLLRSLMPDSYVQRGDQASIIGGAINFVKELEQKLQFLGATYQEGEDGNKKKKKNMAFCEFFTFPQYTRTATATATTSSSSSNSEKSSSSRTVAGEEELEEVAADIEVTMVESHANVKIRSKKKPKQLLKMVSALHNMRLTILHLNVTTTINQLVLYSLSLKVEDDCKLGSVDDIAAAVYQLMNSIQQEAPIILASTN